jgi:uncharacterized damage-inducible protein DinB
MAKKQIEKYIAQCNSIYEGTPWYGYPLKSICDTVSASIVFKQPTKDSHCIAQLVAHVTYWRLALSIKLEGNDAFKPSMTSEDNWKNISALKRTGWKKILHNFHDSQARLIAALATQDDTLLKKRYSEKYTYQQLIEGIIQHDLYHAGQIAYLKNVYAKKKK